MSTDDPESVERFVNGIPDIRQLNARGLLSNRATAELARKDFWRLHRVTTVLVKAMFFLRPHDRSVADVEAMIVSVTRAIAERSGK